MPGRNDARPMLARIRARNANVKTLADHARYANSGVGQVEANRNNNENAKSLVEKVRNRTETTRQMIAERRAKRDGGKKDPVNSMIEEWAKEALVRNEDPLAPLVQEQLNRIPAERLGNQLVGQDRALADGVTPPGFAGPEQISF
jgi:hypothetical protein